MNNTYGKLFDRNLFTDVNHPDQKNVGTFFAIFGKKNVSLQETQNDQTNISVPNGDHYSIYAIDAINDSRITK
jgi:hypothetical protein